MEYSERIQIDQEDRIKLLELQMENMRSVVKIYKQEARGWQEAWSKIWNEQIQSKINGG